jgi:hypothetical protein
MSGAYFDKSVDVTTKEWWVEGNIWNIGLTSVTLTLGSQRCNIVRNIRGYILIWDERTFEDSGIMQSLTCNRIQNIMTDDISFNSTVSSVKAFLGVNTWQMRCKKKKIDNFNYFLIN